MPYKGPPVICRFCGCSFTRPASLVRHLDERRCARKKPSAIIPAWERKGVEIIETVPVSSPDPSKVPYTLLLPKRPVNRREPEGDENCRVKMPNQLSPYDGSGLMLDEGEGAFTIDVKEANDEVTLWSQYHALKALATRLDAGCGTERDRVMFEAILREYNGHYDRVRAGGRQVLGVGIPETGF